MLLLIFFIIIFISVTFCDKLPRKICAPDNCRVVEGAEKCEHKTEQSTIEEPIELCDLQPQKHCSQIKVSVPRLVPERKCRQVEKEICNTQLVNPHDTKKPVIIKYCTKKERVKSTNSYLPPPPPVKQSQYKPLNLPPPPPPIYSSPSTPQPVYKSPSPPVYRPPSSSRSKRDPKEALAAPIVIEAKGKQRFIKNFIQCYTILNYFGISFY